MSYVGEAHEVPTAHCLECGYLLSGASGLNNSAKPADGDISLCIKCGHIAVFSADGALRQPTKTELAEAMDMPDVRQGIAAIARVNAH